VITPSLRPFGTTIFSEMTRLAQEHGAINLAQGFPDFDGPPEMIEAAHRAMRDGQNQYARSQGHPLLVHAVAEKVRRHYGLDPDPLREVAVFSGATEAIASSLLGLLDGGDEVILFEPFYDSYPAMVARAGGVARCCTLRFPEMSFDPEELRALFGPRTRVLVLNTPHNPTGKVFTRAELELVAELCREHDVLVIADEVYEHLTYGDAEHVPIASLPGMWERTLTISSAGKTYSFTGWKVGWAVGPAELIAAAQAAHQFVTFATATPLQVAVAWALAELPERYLSQLRIDYTRRRDFLLDAVRRAGFRPSVPQGTYFILADFSALSSEDDRSFARRMTAEHGVAVIPPTPFYAAHPEEGRRLVRFAFCKREETLRAAAEKLARLAP
jgi:N-succinyldiaminopimelate aminotransferase